MEFWAVEVKAGEPFKVELPEKRAVHLSQVSIGEVKKDISVSICLSVNVNGNKFALGTLNPGKLFQQSFDLVFDKTFELSHNWKDGSIFFLGYTADNDPDSVEESSESDEDIPVLALNGGPATEVKQESQVSAGKDSAAEKQKAKIVEPKKDVSSDNTDDSSDDDDDETSSEDEPKVSVKKDSAAEKQKAKIVEPRKDVSSDDTDDSSDDDETSSEDDPKISAKGSAAGKQKMKIVEPKNDADSSDDDDAMSEDDSEDDEDNKIALADEDSDSDEDDETPVQVKSSKKRASVSASKTAVPQKKAKLTTPPKTDGKKSSVHVDTPYPSKQAGKTFANKPDQQTPKTEGSHSCKPCKRTFKSEVALESHNKAKHSGGK